MTTVLVTRPVTDSRARTGHPTVDPEHPRHRHSGSCWWDVARARWVCD